MAVSNEIRADGHQVIGLAAEFRHRNRQGWPPCISTVKLGTGKTFSITGRNAANGAANATPGQGTSATQLRDAKYTVEQLNAGWQAFMKANPTYHILVNTMRASYPALVEGHTYRVMVENEKQREELETHMQPLLATLRDATANDHISIIIELNQGEASPPHMERARSASAHGGEKSRDARLHRIATALHRLTPSKACLYIARNRS